MIGRSITVDAKPRTVIGVMPAGFSFLDVLNADILVETDAQGRGNWVFDTGAKPTQPSAPQPVATAPPRARPRAVQTSFSFT